MRKFIISTLCSLLLAVPCFAQKTFDVKYWTANGAAGVALGWDALNSYSATHRTINPCTEIGGNAANPSRPSAGVYAAIDGGQLVLTLVTTAILKKKQSKYWHVPADIMAAAHLTFVGISKANGC